jgi:membrane protease YdiL (CAAX protease family)
MIAMLGTNIFSEEVFFRGYLFRKSLFLGRWTWIANGLLFIAYHIFQIPLTYAIFPVGLMVSGYFA